MLKRPESRTFYSYAIVINAFYLLILVVQSIAFWQLGRMVYELPSTVSWLIFSFAVTIVTWLVQLWYYHNKAYTFSFWMLVGAVILTIIQFVIFLQISATHEMSALYIPVAGLNMVVGLIYGFSLVFSQAGKRKWLMVLGIFTIFLQLVSIGYLTLAVVSKAAIVDGTVEMAEKWIGALSCISVVFVLMNFVNERSTAEKITENKEGTLSAVMAISTLAIIFASLILIPTLAMDGVKKYANPNEVGDYVKNVADAYDAAVWVSANGKTLPYRLQKPLDYDSTKSYPFVVCLHGSSGCGNDNYKQVLTALPAQILNQDSARRKYQAFVLVPQCPVRSTWGGIEGAPAVDSLVMELITAIQLEFSLDTNRCYITGNSLGGYGTWHLIAKYPERFAAAVPICGWGDASLASQMTDMPIWAFHGAKDENVPVSGSRDVIDAIRKAGGHPRYTEYPDAAHNINKNVTENPELLTWMFSQKK